MALGRCSGVHGCRYLYLRSVGSWACNLRDEVAKWLIRPHKCRKKIRKMSNRMEKEAMYAVIKNFVNGDKKVVYKTADILQARDYAESLNEDFDDPDGAHYTVGMVKEIG